MYLVLTYITSNLSRLYECSVVSHVQHGTNNTLLLPNRDTTTQKPPSSNTSGISYQTYLCEDFTDQALRLRFPLDYCILL